MPLPPLGFVPRAAGGGTATWEYVVDPAHYNMNGVLTAASSWRCSTRRWATPSPRSSCPQGRFNAAAQFNIHFLHPIKSGLVRARAEVKKIGKRLAVVEAEATDEAGLVLGIATSTHSLLP